LLVGLSFTQYVDAMFLGLGVEPEGSPDWYVDALPALIIDAFFVSALLVLAVKASHRSRTSVKVTLWVYSIDTLVFLVGFVTSIWFRVNGTFYASAMVIGRQGLTVVAHILGIFILFHAMRVTRPKIEAVL
jgi:hypothetical protein